jgi:hypothetical protein
VVNLSWWLKPGGILDVNLPCNYCVIITEWYNYSVYCTDKLILFCLKICTCIFIFLPIYIYTIFREFCDKCWKNWQLACWYQLNVLMRPVQTTLSRHISVVWSLSTLVAAIQSVLIFNFPLKFWTFLSRLKNRQVRLRYLAR